MDSTFKYTSSISSPYNPKTNLMHTFRVIIGMFYVKLGFKIAVAQQSRTCGAAKSIFGPITLNHINILKRKNYIPIFGHIHLI